jgi:hypothetical protein
VSALYDDESAAAIHGLLLQLPQLQQLRVSHPSGPAPSQLLVRRRPPSSSLLDPYSQQQSATPPHCWLDTAARCLASHLPRWPAAAAPAGAGHVRLGSRRRR